MPRRTSTSTTWLATIAATVLSSGRTAPAMVRSADHQGPATREQGRSHYPDEQPGDPYRESIAVSGGYHSGIATFPFEIIGNGSTLDGSLALADAEWEFVSGDIFRVRPPKVRFNGCF